MGRRVRQRRREMTIVCRFEPTRLGREPVRRAYEDLVPLYRRRWDAHQDRRSVDVRRETVQEQDAS